MAMISYRQADLMDQMAPVITCKMPICFTNEGTFYYDPEPMAYAFDKIKPLQDQIDTWFINNWGSCDRVAVGWLSPDKDLKVRHDLMEFLAANPKIKNLEIKEKDARTLYVYFGYQT